MSRPDLVSMFDTVRDDAELIFVEYALEWGSGVAPAVYAEYGELRPWETSVSARRLLSETRPDLVAFVNCTSLNQVALRMAARARGVRCVHVEHGLRWMLAPTPLAPSKASKVGPSVSSWHTHRFFLLSVAAAPRSANRLISYACRLRADGSTDDVLRRNADLRRLDHYISFSAGCFDYHRDLDQVGPLAVSCG